MENAQDKIFGCTFNAFAASPWIWMWTLEDSQNNLIGVGETHYLMQAENEAREAAIQYVKQHFDCSIPDWLRSSARNLEMHNAELRRVQVRESLRHLPDWHPDRAKGQKALFEKAERRSEIQKWAELYQEAERQIR